MMSIICLDFGDRVWGCIHVRILLPVYCEEKTIGVQYDFVLMRLDLVITEALYTRAAGGRDSQKFGWLRHNAFGPLKLVYIFIQIHIGLP